MWWGDNAATVEASRIELVTEDNIPVANGSGEFTLENTAYPFSEDVFTQSTVKLNA